MKRGAIPMGAALMFVIGCGDPPGVKGPPLTTDGPNQVLVKVAGMT
jgi:hypothetical protein